MTVTTGNAKSTLEERLQFESMLADLSSGFVTVEPSEVDDQILDAQQLVCECLGFDVAALWQLDPARPGVLLMTHLYRPGGGPPIPDAFEAEEINPWTLDRISAGHSVVLPDIDDAPPEAAVDRETWKHFQLRSVFCFPLVTGTEPAIGAVSFHTQRKATAFPEETVRRLSLVSQVFTNALKRKRTDAYLRESEERLQLAASSAELGMWALDIAEQRFWANERGREIFGFLADEQVTVERFLETVDEGWRDSVVEAVRRAIDDDLPIDIEYRISLADGSHRWLHSCGRLQPASAVRPARVLGSTSDITERKRSEEELQRAFTEVQVLKHRLEIENAYLRSESQLEHGRGRIVGESPLITEVLRMVEQVAPTETSVLVEGETGTGKELVSRRIHELSPRNDRPLVKVNCAALPSTLVETELFGREKGAYTGAISRQAGRFEIADGATILLDEIAELPFGLQPKLLRVLEEGEFERVGSSKTLTTDLRVIAATNRDLEAEVEAGRFRKDLFFRLAVFPIRVPPLRERRSDIPLLVWAIVQELGSGMNKAVESIKREDMERLQAYDWPGNVRELRNVVERAMILCTGPLLRLAPPSLSGMGDEATLSLDEVQRRHILKIVDLAGGQIRGSGGAAEVLGVNPTTLRSRMQRLGIDPKTLRDD